MSNPTNKTAYNLLLKNWFQYEAGYRAMLPLFYHGLERNGCVNCFVNLNQYLSHLYKRTDYAVDDPYCIAASIINFCAHIINFFDTRFGIRAAVYLVYGSNKPYYSITTYEHYNAHMITTISTRPEVTKIIEDNLAIVNTICPYIPNVYYFRDDNCEPAIAMRRIIKFISLKGNKHPRLIFSKEYYDLQLIATTPKTHLVRVKKTIQGDQTFTVSYFNFYTMLTRIKKLKKPIGVGISPELYSLYLAYIGCPDKDINAVMNAPSTDKLIHEYIESGKLLNGHNELVWLNNYIYHEADDTFQNIMNRFQAIDLIFQSMDRDSTTPLCDTVMVELYDPNGVRFIADRYFHKYPLDLNIF